jgi:acetyl-CoA synthetase
MSDLVKTPKAVADHTQLSHDEFLKKYQQSMQENDLFWAETARKELTWIKDFSITRSGEFDDKVNIEWFSDGQLNVSANCLDRHLEKNGDKTAIIWVGDDPKEKQIITYKELADSVNRWANLLKQYGVKKGDIVVIYLPMIPQAAMAMQACARIGAVHSVVFGGFSAQALQSRIVDSGAKLVITVDEGKRGGKNVPLKSIVDEAIETIAEVKTVLVVKRTGTPVEMKQDRDIYVEELLEEMPAKCTPEVMDAEDPLFILYTSGSTGKPKGLVHTQAGYLLYSSLTFKTLFDYKPDDIYFCTADIGWITGHSYIVYGPLANGATVLMFEGIPTYPEADRFWKIIDEYKVTIFYTAPTAIRSLMRLGDQYLKTTKRDSLRIMGSVGEPINPEAWLWYFNKVGKGKAAIVDTWWQTENGGHMIAPPPSTKEVKPGLAMQPFFGIEPVLIDAQNNIIEGEGEGGLFIKRPWPGIARTIFGKHDRFLETYFSQKPGMYCTGDGAVRDTDGDYRITGRVDDVINVSGHRFGTAEIESALVSYQGVAEAAVVGRDHEIKGTAIYAYVILKDGVTASDELKKQLNNHVRKQIGAIASIDWLQFVPGLPKTRSGKIMRRILRKIAAGQNDELGDISTLADPEIVQTLISGRIA